MSQNKIVEWFGPHFTGNEGLLVNEVLKSGYINDGPKSRELESKIAKFTSSKYAVAVTSGTVAIALSLIAAGVVPDDEVLVPNLTFAATANAVILAGAKPILVEKLKKAISKKTTAIVAVDVNGRCGDYPTLNEICEENKLILICDSAEALGSKSLTQSLGTFGLAGCFSFSANKTVSSGQGGLIVTDSVKVFNRLKELKDQGRALQGSGGDDLHPSIGFNFKFTDIQAAVALSQFKDLERRLSRARNRDEMYRHYLSNIEGLTTPPSKSESGEVLQWFDILSKNRTVIQNALQAKGYMTRAFWRPLSAQGIYESSASFPISEAVSREGLWLPSRYDLNEENVRDMSLVIKNSLIKNT